MPKGKPAKKTAEKIKLKQPIVAVMGHVDHGKTTFLDSIRDANIAAKEAGGITQNTRAHEVVTKSGFRITFIDTPGHEAFSKMRERGARVTDFVVLMVAADDGLQPQTKESIQFAKDNNVPIIVCINKVDLPGVKLEKIKQELSSFGVVIEEYGGDALCFEISALKKTGLNEVLEGIELLTEIKELKEKPPKEGVEAEAFVMESKLDKNIGYSALAILKAGNLNDRIFGVTKDQIFKVRAYIDENNKSISTVREGQPFTITGLKDDLSTGEIINFVTDEKKAKELQENLKTGQVSEDEEKLDESLDLEALFAQMLVKKEEKDKGLEQKKLNVVIKSSTQGTLEAIIAELDKLETEESKVNVLQSGTGPVNEDDLNRAKVAKGIVLSFQNEIPNPIIQKARQNKVIVRQYEIIYELIDEIAEVLDGMDQPQEEEVEMSRAKVKQVFTLSNGDQVVGCVVTENKFVKGYQVKVVRPNPGAKETVELGRSKITSVRQGKNEVKEVKKGTDCGMLLNPKIDSIAEGDEIVAFRIERY